MILFLLLCLRLRVCVCTRTSHCETDSISDAMHDLPPRNMGSKNSILLLYEILSKVASSKHFPFITIIICMNAKRRVLWPCHFYTIQILHNCKCKSPIVFIINYSLLALCLPYLRVYTFHFIATKTRESMWSMVHFNWTVLFSVSSLLFGLFALLKRWIRKLKKSYNLLHGRFDFHCEIWRAIRPR